MKLKVFVISVSLILAGCNREKKATPAPAANVSVNLTTAQDKSLPASERITACENYLNATKRGDDLVVPLRAFISDKEAWAYTPRLSALLAKMGPAAVPLKADLVKRQNESPNSQGKRWQDCIDAIRER
jgi:hypothetical protein